MMEQGAVFIFDDLSQVEEAIRTLAREGVPIDQVSVVVWDSEQENEAQDHVTSGEAIKGGTITGAGIGALLHLFIDMTSVQGPGLGPLLVAEQLASVILSGFEGAMAGVAGASLLRPFVSDDVFEPYRLEYQKRLKKASTDCSQQH